MSSDRNASSKRDCQHCVYGGCLRDGRAGCPLAELAGVLLCVNRPESPGRPVLVDPGGSCPNFRARREPAVWTTPPEPPSDEIRHIPLTKGLYAIVDAADYEWLSRYKWTALVVGSQAYAIRSHKGKTILMHREIMQPPPGMVVDHINGNGVNNRRCNMRVCTPQQNRYNSRPRTKKSKYKGVRFDEQTGRWFAEITHNGVKYHLGTFDDEVEAARAYDRKAVELQGPFARLNFPDEWPAPPWLAQRA